MVGQAIEHRGGHLGVAEHLGPIGEGKVGGDQQGGVLVELADQMEQQLATGLAERQIAEFVDDDEIMAQQLLCQPAAAAGGLLLLELIDQIDQVEEASPGATADDCGGDGDAQMGFAGAGTADEDGIALGIQERTGGAFTNQSGIDGGVGEGEFVQVLEDRELGAAVDAKARLRDAIADRAGLSVGAFGADQTGDEGIELIAPGQPFAGNLIEAGAHAEELQFAHGFHDLMPFHQATFLMLS